MILAKQQVTNILEFKNSGIISIEAIKQGTINQNYVVTTKHDKYFVRINNPDVAGVDREIEKKILNQLSDLQITPKVIVNNLESGYLILEYLPLTSWTSENCIQHQSQLLTLLSKVHQIQLPRPFPQLQSRLERYEIASNKYSSEEFKLEYRHNKLKLIEFGFFELNKLVHFDLNARNLLGTDPLYIIDWEFAGAAHPIFDLALFIYYNKLNKEQYPLILDYCNQYQNGVKILKYSIKLAKDMTQMWEMIQNKPSPNLS
jgi:thiamine kinase